MALFLISGKSDPVAKARSLIPDEIAGGAMVLGKFSDKNGAALFEIDGQIPSEMRSFEPRLDVGRIVRPKVKTVRWKSTPVSVHVRTGQKDCSCFACATDPQICKIAADWSSEEGSLFYLSSSSEGTSYLLNRESKKIIIVWNRAL